MTAAAARPRVDARAKVTGAARYGTDRTPEGLAYAAMAVATVGKGRVVEIDTAAAAAVAGVRLVLTRFEASELKPPVYIMAGGHAVQSLQPLLSDHIAYRGQPIALVVADTPVAATEAANRVCARYEAAPFALELDDEDAEKLRQPEALPVPALADIAVGDAEAVFAGSEVRVDEVYDHPKQAATPMELLGCVVEWRGDTVVVHEGTQNAGALRNGLALQLGIDPADVEVISPYLGGGFGQKNSLQPHLGPVALAARRLGRPVKFVMTRPQTFHQGSFRPASRHRVRLGADGNGRLTAAIYEVDQETSRHDLFPAMYTEAMSRLYGVPNFSGPTRLVRVDTQTPGYMRAPFESPASFAFESAVDELAYAVGRDPVALRLANDTGTDPITGQPFSSRHVAECLRRGAERFGWAARDPAPGSMRADDGSLIGWGVAIGAYPACVAPAIAHVRAGADGRVVVAVDGHEMGQGIRSAITFLVADDLGIAVDRVTVDIGDTRVAPQHLTAGSWGTASALPAVHAALRELRARLGVAETGMLDVGAAVAAAGQPTVEAEAATLGPGQPPEMLDRSRAGKVAFTGPVYPGFTSFSFVAHFVEVRIEATTRRVRVPRVVSVVDCGRVASAVTAASQVRGGVVWGLGAALREASEPERRYGGFFNATMEEYVISVNADIGEIEVDFIDEPDPLLNPVGVKGLGEVALVGVVPAVTNAVFHATGQRLRRVPITIADLL
ncbi:xanthine dehydrogenase family protein molybdopterin-binding subunit [Actinoplanes regularis]|uniref:Xanthine dehydrogenase YagR molybdenum-binding subunit n=1 Tax=Actinoplanes regularis TaxID=52697 RepID=A0A239IB35_9ACTN|nr:xanthine dehydrogenase family protein molybdopterin-binding subunit [Actinoplanes regularis]GIE90749.1 xanthine dehydrogenase [Actinoplanes regularis]SNS90761.1 xanthine dehydrogenase YagR molybdenum-binding subunit [Actinoplanes regularis]